MTDELRAAARLAEGVQHALSMIGRIKERHPEVPDEGWRELDEIRHHLLGTLAEHPADDGEAVTAEWLRSVGLAEKWYDDTFGVGFNSPTGGVAIQLNGRVMVQAGGSVSYFHAATAATRGAVRRLCAALGVPLAEDNHA